MIAVVSVEIQAANPSMPLYPWRAYVNSPSSLRIRNVPRRVGNWNIDKVYVSAAYPDGSIKSAECVLVGGIWVCTIAGSTVSGFSQNGYTIFADGKDENGNEVTGYVLGKGDITILEADGTITPGETTYYVHMLSAEPTAPKDGDLWQLSGTWYIYQDGTSYPIGDDSGLIQQLSARVDGVETALTGKADISSTVLNPIYSQTPTFSEWTYSQAPETPDAYWDVYDTHEDEWGLIEVPDGETIESLLSKGELGDHLVGTSAGGSDAVLLDFGGVTATRTRTDVIGYTLGDQDDKPLASANALSAKQDKLSDTQILAINSVVDERQTTVKFDNNEIRHYDVAGELTQAIRQGWETDAGSIVKEVKIGNTVTSIGDEVFAGCSITSVMIPDSVTSIGGASFADCSGLSSVTIPDSVTSIGNYAFANCDGLTSVTIPASLESIAGYAFAYCDGLTNVTIGNGVESIAGYAFSCCTNLSSVTIPDSVTSIGGGAFDGCTHLANITVVGKTQAQAEELLTDTGVSLSIITTWNDASQEWVKDQNYLSSVPATYKTYQETVSSLSNDGYATTAYAVRNLSGVANAISMPLSSYESISATADAETLYVITED